MKELRGKTAVVMGASSGIGLALAKELATEGMNLVVVSSKEERIKKAAEYIEAAGGQVAAAVCDVARYDQVQAVAELACDRFGGVDVLCNNAGVTTLGPLVRHTNSDWKWLLDVNVMGIVHGICAFLPRMVERGSGHICNTGSPTAFMPDAFVGHGPYPATKAAVAALTTTLRNEVGPKGVEVSLLLPSGVPSDIMRGAVDHGPCKPGEFGMSLNPHLPAPDEKGRQYTSADFLARMTVAGIKRNAPVIAAASALRPYLVDYFDRILAGFDEWAAFEALQDVKPAPNMPGKVTGEPMA